MKGILFLLIFCISGCASGAALSTSPLQNQEEQKQEYSYEGEFNPKDFLQWSVVGVAPSSDPNFGWMIVANPDSEHLVKTVNVLLTKMRDGFYIIGYRYEKEGVSYVYVLNDDGKYIRQFEESSEETPKTKGQDC